MLFHDIADKYAMLTIDQLACPPRIHAVKRRRHFVRVNTIANKDACIQAVLGMHYARHGK